MKRNYPKPLSPMIAQDLISRAAFHEAGHAVAIYLYNQRKQLPPVYFSIKFNNIQKAAVSGSIARIEGGRLIQTLPACANDFNEYTSSSEESVKNAYISAFEADIVNLFSGPIAEAKHVALADGEDFSLQHLSPASLKFYGAATDLKLINSYMNSCYECQPEKNNRIMELFKMAFEFVNEATNWSVITTLARYIENNSKQFIECEEAIAVIDLCLASA